MSQRGIQTRNNILQAAKKLFMQNGYVAVTMSDICEETELSRGGLYRHYTSTKEIFLELLTIDKNDWEEATKKAMTDGMSALNMLTSFLEQTYLSILDGEGRLSLAIYEFERTEPDANDFFLNRYAAAIGMMERVLQYGQSRGEFDNFDAKLEAEFIVIFIDGLKMASVGLSLSHFNIKQQLDNLLTHITRLK